MRQASIIMAHDQTHLEPSKSAAARENISVAGAFVRYLETTGVTYVFGIPGGFIAPFLKLLRRSEQLEFIIGRQETGCAFMADGYARVTGKLGVVLVTSGPGALNALNGVACAQMGQSSVMLVSGQHPISYDGLGALQEASNDGVNIVGVFGHACASSELVVSPKVFRTRLLQASRLCLGRPRQAAHLSFPLDVSSSMLERLDLPEARAAYALATPTTDQAVLDQVFDLLVNASNPLLLLGTGCREALRENPDRLQSLCDLARARAIPVVTSAQAKGVFPEGHVMSLGVHGVCGSRQAEGFVRETRPDVVLVIGSSLGEWTTRSWDTAWLPSRALIQIDVDPKMIGRHYPTQASIVGDAGVSIDGLIARGRAAEPAASETGALDTRRRRVAAFKERVAPFSRPEVRERVDGMLAPQRLMKELNEVIPRRTSIFVDNGNCLAWALHHMQIEPPTEIYLSLAMASMGWANGAVIGAKLGAPDRTCICLTGDGSFLMSGAEISTAARYRVGAIWIILYDNSLGMVNHGEMVTGDYEFAIDDPHYELGNPDVVGFARALGADGYWIERAGQLRELFPAVLAGADAGKPQVIAARIDPRELAPILDRFATIKAAGK
jgi:acetolactate synthase-1/2/3 large subunit